MKDLYHTVSEKIAETQNKLAEIGFPRIEIDLSIERLKPGFAGIAYCASEGFMNADECSKKAGIKYYTEPTIKISCDYLAECEEEVLNRTVPHEVCHVYVHKYFTRAKQAHGPEFRRLMKALGLDGSTYHKMKLENGPQRKKNKKLRFVYVRPSTGEKIHVTKKDHEKSQSGRYTFSVKGEVIKFTGESVYIL